MPYDRKSKAPPHRKSAGGPPRARPDRASKKRLEELIGMGIPRRFAQQIAAGQRELNEVLQEMAQQDRVEKLIEQHDIPRSLAVQVVLGHADLDAYLAKRRRHAYRDEVGARSIFDEAVSSGDTYSLALLGRKLRSSKVLASDRYELQIQDHGGGDPETLHKLTVKLAYRAEDRKAARKAISQDKAYKGVVAEPAWRIQDRYHCPDKRLFPWLEAGTRLVFTTVEGDRVTGTVSWFSRYEIGVTARDVELVLFRHALASVRED
jgi:hypothetical protein